MMVASVRVLIVLSAGARLNSISNIHIQDLSVQASKRIALTVMLHLDILARMNR